MDIHMRPIHPQVHLPKAQLKFFNFINQNLDKKKLNNIVEIGCNDIYTLEQLKDRADTLYGIDPILKGIEKKYSEENIILIGDYFENVDLGSYGIDMDVVICSQTLERISDPKKWFFR